MIRRRHRKLLVRIMSGFLALTLSCSTSGSFFSIFDSNNDKHFPSAGEPSGNDSVSASTNMSGKEEGTSPKLDPLSGTVQIPAPQIGNYGTVNLSYPVVVPSGRAGYQPSVGLSYSSSGGDGLVGIGWSLSTGVPVISRTTSNGELYYDYRDTFTYNGKRLVKVSGSSTSEEGVYRCEIESDFARIEMRSASSGGVWYIFDKSGAVTILGESTDSRVYQPTNINETYIWNYSRSYDLNGNYMIAVYDTSEYATNHILYLKELQYTGNYDMGINPRQFVRFNYTTRDDAYVSKGAGFIMRMTRMLDSIVVGWDDPKKLLGTDRELWRYTMNYALSEDSGRPLLQTIDSTKNTTKPTFVYQKALHSFVWRKIANQWASDTELDPKKTKYFEGDFNGDGISDMVVFNPETGDWKVAEGTRGGGYTFKTYGNKFKGYDSASKIQFFKGNVTGDYNGDGRSDIAFFLPETREFVVAECDGKVFQFKSYGKLTAQIADIFSCEWFTGDFDGNGLSDALLFNEKTGEWILMRNLGGSFSFQIIATHFKNLFRNDYSPNGNLDSPSTLDNSPMGRDRDRVQFFSGDFNGDGRTDISIYDVRTGRWYVGENYRTSTPLSVTSSVGFTIQWKLYKEFTAPEQALFSHDRFCGDFNGDGFSDFLLFNRDTGEWIIGETGDGTINFRVFCKLPSAIRQADITRWLQGDFNGDGKTDIGFYSKTDNNFWIGEATKSGFRFRIYNNLSYGPDPATVMATPLPLDEVEITQGKTVVSSSTTTYPVDYSYDGNYHRGKGENAYAGLFGGVPSLLLFNKDKKTYSQKTGSADPIPVSAVTLDLNDASVAILNKGRAGKFKGSNDALLVYQKTGASGSESHNFYTIDTASQGTLASFQNSTIDFDIAKSIYSVDTFDSAAQKLLVCDDKINGTFDLVSGTTSIPLTFGSSSALGADYFKDVRSRREQIRVMHGVWGSVASLVIADLSGTTPVWYLGTVTSSQITFKQLSGSPTIVSSSYDAFDYHATSDGLVYAAAIDSGYVFHKITFNTVSAAVSETSATVSGVTFSNDYDWSNLPVVYKDGVIKTVTVSAGSATLNDPTSLSAKTFDRPDLLTNVYPFEWIQGDYNGDGKTDIGIFHLKEPTWYFAVTTGTVPDMISSVQNGIGGSYSFEYANSTTFDNTGTDGIPHLPMNYKVCTRLTIDDGFGRTLSNQYDYANGYAFSSFINGKKETDYFGFSTFTTRDSLGNKTTNLYNTTPYSDFRQNRALAGAIKQSSFVGTDYKEYTRTNYEYTLHEIVPSPLTPLPGGEGNVPKSFLIEPTKVVKYINGTLFETKTSNITLEANKYELVSKTDSTTDHYSDSVRAATTVTNYQEFSYNESTNETRLTYKKNLVGTNRETRSDYQYDTKGNLITETTSYTGSGLAKPKDRTMRYEYDGYGNRTRTVNASESPNRISDASYDDVLHQYLVEERSLGDITLSTQYEINYASAFGAAQKKTDPNGNSIYYEYDDYGRLYTQRLDTDNGVETLAEYTYGTYGGTSIPTMAKVTQYTGDGGKKETRTFVDGMGRTLHSVWSATGESGKKYAKSGALTYDAIGRLVRKGQTQWAGSGEIDSYVEATEVNPTITDYDPSGRVKKVTLPQAFAGESETSTSYTYNDPWETIVTHSIGRSKRTVKNARGLVLYVEDKGAGDDSNTISASIGFEYDIAGSRIKKMDLNGATMNTSIDSSLFAPGKKDTSGTNIAQWRYDGFGEVTDTSDPDLGYSGAVYNGFGDVTQRIDAQNRYTSYTYDKLGRMIQKDLPGSEGKVKYYYDTPFDSAQGDNSKGKLTAIDDPAQVKKLSYDKVGHISHEEREIKGNDTVFETNFTFDLLSRTKTIQYPVDPATKKRIKTEYSYNSYGVTGIRITQGYFSNKDVVSDVQYNEFGQMTSVTRGNDTISTYDYDVRGRLTHLVTKHSGETLQDVKYDFRVDNSIKSKEDSFGTDDAARKVRYEYSYDGLNRLADATGSYLQGSDTTKAKSFHHSYSYSLNGNLTSKTTYDAIGSVDDKWSYSYASTSSASGHAVQTISSSKTGSRFSMKYDLSGNITFESDTQNKTKDMEYDSSNRLASVTDHDTGTKVGEYWYDDQGFRVKKISADIVNGAEGKVEVLYPSMYFAIEKELDSDGNEIQNSAYACNNIYLNGIRIAASLPNGQCQYYHTDQVDSVGFVTDDSGTIVTRTEYLPFGESWMQEGNLDNRPKYQGQEFDAESGLYYMNARYQNPTLCRFETPDTVIDGEYDTQGWNRYSYCKNNPIMYKDPSGHGIMGAIFGAMVGSLTANPVLTEYGAMIGSDIEDRSKSNGTNQTKQAQSSARAPDRGSAPRRINGPIQPDDVIDRLAQQLIQSPNGNGQKVLDETFGKTFWGSSRANAGSYCMTNSIFLGLAKLGRIEPSIDAYKDFAKYAANNNYIDRQTGRGIAMDTLANKYGASFERKKANEGAWDLYRDVLRDGNPNTTVSIVQASGHGVASSPKGDGTDYRYDTGETTTGKKQENRRRYPVNVETIQQTIILRKMEGQ